MYNNSELELFNKNIDEISKKLDVVVSEKLAPTVKEINEITKIVSKYIKDHKRKVYGGTALNLAVKEKEKADAFYSDEESHDFDTYSPEPIKDVVELCDIIHKQGYKNVTGREAIHRETYTVAVNGHPYCDFSYVPRNVYNRIPFIEIEGYIITHPYFMMIDYMRMFVNPLLAHFRWSKSFGRYYYLQ
jgi:hypothetical protein